MSEPAHTLPAPVKCHQLYFLSVIGGFLDGQTFEFSNGLNCMIGARGTGKTTLLEFVRYVLDVLPSDDNDLAERRRIESLVQRNLGNGRIQVGIETKYGLRYLVNRSWGEDPIVMNADGSPSEVMLRAHSVFRADIFSQNEIKGIANHPMSQLRLIDDFEIEPIAEVDARIQHVLSALEVNANQITPLGSQATAIGEELSTLPNVEARCKAFSNENGGDESEVNLAYALRSLRDREQRVIDGTGRVLQATDQAVEALTGRLVREAMSLVDPEVAEGPNGRAINQIVQQLVACGQDLDCLFEQASRRTGEALRELATCIVRLSTVHKEQELSFRTLLERRPLADGETAERIRLEKLRNDLLGKKRTREQLRHQLSILQQERVSLLRHLSELQDERFAIRKGITNGLTESLTPTVRVNVTQYGNLARYERLLQDRLHGARMKAGVVAQRLASAFWPAELSAVIARKDLQALVEKAELNHDHADRVICALSDANTLMELETVELYDRPQIELKDGENYKDSSELSTGQKCTAILPILLLDSDDPLLIDQPEDNLDNHFLCETVVDRIRRIKCRRQLIFATRNPNIPVLAEAEKIFVLDSDGSAARVVNQGTVDQCKTNIVTLLEGGEEAFRKRKERYAY